MGTTRGPGPTPPGAAGGTQLVLFQLAGKSFAADLAQVEQIIEYREPVRTPRRAAHVEGVVEHRGHYLALVNLRTRLNVAESAPNNPAILLLRGIGPDLFVGVLVDQVLRVLSIPAGGILRPPPRVFGIRSEYIRGVANAGGRPLVWLDIPKILTTTEPITLLA